MSAQMAAAHLQAQHNRRHESDRKLSLLKMILLGIVTFGIYYLVCYWRMINRRDEHMERQTQFFDALLAFIQYEAAATGRDLTAELSEMAYLMSEVKAKEQRRTAWLWLLLLFVPVVNYFTLWYSYHFLNQDFYEHDLREKRLVFLATSGLTKLGRMSGPIMLQPTLPKRSTLVYVLATIFTLGFFGLYWLYTICNDPNEHFDRHGEWEMPIMISIFGMPGYQTSAV